ncbi:protoporphyrinogen/coproporphyrinogen oxidase [Aureimonas leprariae]|uniref:FAD-dependent oxidoreductase n=1 Tax=Plantimonas leprariae TaxID=2615207 RepID=A0A7V7TV82_9HYPH|nr:FAD-dependent oxidoreductase [Aureimonas leprariae]KAB0677079.1 FAD-dependent oxidoreductase [Aureimonas leprariae]
MKPIAILGAGLAGLTAAADLKKRGLPVIVFEAGPAIGGMAASFKDAEGFSYDFGAHFVSNRLAKAMGTEDICRTVKHYGEAVLVGGRMRSHPFGLMREPRFALGALKAKLSAKRAPAASAADWFRGAYGEALAEAVAIPLAEAWSGAPAAELAPSVGEKFGHGALKSLYLTAAQVLTGRAVCNGYTREMPESAGVYHVYPEGGLSKLLAPMATSVASNVRLGSPVEKVVVEGGRVVAVRSKGETTPVSAVVSTAPVNVLPKLVEGTAALDELASFRYRPMIFVNLKFEGRGLLPDTMLWVPEGGTPFFRLTEAPISMPWLAPEGKTLITADIGCQVGDEWWTMPDADLAEACLAGMNRIFGDLGPRYLGAGGVIRTSVAYPVHLEKYEAARRRFALATGVEGLWSVGRNGEFAHILMEDVYWRTKRRMEEVAAFVGGGARGAEAADHGRIAA